MPLNSPEVRPSVESPETVSFAATVQRIAEEQLSIACKATDEIIRLQEELARQLGAQYGPFLAALEEKAPELEKVLPAESLFDCLSHTWRIRDAASGFERAISRQKYILVPFAKMFDGMGVSHE